MMTSLHELAEQYRATAVTYERKAAELRLLVPPSAIERRRLALELEMLDEIARELRSTARFLANYYNYTGLQFSDCEPA